MRRTMMRSSGLVLVVLLLGTFSYQGILRSAPAEEAVAEEYVLLLTMSVTGGRVFLGQNAAGEQKIMYNGNAAVPPHEWELYWDKDEAIIDIVESGEVLFAATATKIYALRGFSSHIPTPYTMGSGLYVPKGTQIIGELSCHKGCDRGRAYFWLQDQSEPKSFKGIVIITPMGSGTFLVDKAMLEGGSLSTPFSLTKGGTLCPWIVGLSESSDLVCLDPETPSLYCVREGK